MDSATDVEGPVTGRALSVTTSYSVRVPRAAAENPSRRIPCLWWQAAAAMEGSGMAATAPETGAAPSAMILSGLVGLLVVAENQNPKIPSMPTRAALNLRFARETGIVPLVTGMCSPETVPVGAVRPSLLVFKWLC